MQATSYSCPTCEAEVPNKSSVLRHLCSAHHRPAMSELGREFWPMQRPVEGKEDKRTCNACRQPIQRRNWPEHVGAKHRGIYTVCPEAGNLPCGSQARGSVDGSSWEAERAKLGDKSWWADGKGEGGE